MNELEEWLRGEIGIEGPRRSAYLGPRSCDLHQYPFGSIAQGYGATLAEAIQQALAVAKEWSAWR